MRNEIFLTDISAIMAQIWYDAIHRLKQVVYCSNCTPADCALKFVAYHVKITQIETLYRIKVKLNFNILDYTTRNKSISEISKFIIDYILVLCNINQYLALKV